MFKYSKPSETCCNTWLWNSSGFLGAQLAQEDALHLHMHFHHAVENLPKARVAPKFASDTWHGAFFGPFGDPKFILNDSLPEFLSWGGGR